MKSFSVKRYWEVCDTVMVQAETPEQAIREAHQIDEYPFDNEPEVVPDSLNTDEETDVKEIV